MKTNIFNFKIGGAVPLLSSLFFLVVFISLIGFASAAQPTVSVPTQTLGIQIEAPLIDPIYAGELFKFHIHAHNATSGKLLTNLTTQCIIHLYGHNGGHLIEDNMGFDGNAVDFKYDVLGGNLTEGTGSVLFYCNNSEAGGFLEYSFEVIQNPDIVSFSEPTSDWRIFLILVVLAIILLIISIYTENYIFAFFSGLLFLIAGAYGMIYGFDNINDFYTRAISIILLGIGMIITVISGLNLSKSAYRGGGSDDD